MAATAEPTHPCKATAKLAADFPHLTIRAVCTDLGREEFLGAIAAECQDLEIGVLVNNAALKAMPIEDAVSANGEGMKQVFASLLGK